MRLYIPAAKHAAHMSLKRHTPADLAKFDAIMDAIHAAARQLFEAITTGEAAEAHQRPRILPGRLCGTGILPEPLCRRR